MSKCKDDSVKFTPPRSENQFCEEGPYRPDPKKKQFIETGARASQCPGDKPNLDEVYDIPPNSDFCPIPEFPQPPISQKFLEEYKTNYAINNPPICDRQRQVIRGYGFAPYKDIRRIVINRNPKLDR